ncbi:MAG: HAMP domain-containing histidine kinase [Bacteroidetes bacterium]|nr:HAMP domain-containing histidine kinase [Bacteroidota bacterium]
MKLLTKYRQLNLIATCSILLVSAFCYYIVVWQILIAQLDEDLTTERQEVMDFVKINDNLPLPINNKTQQLFFVPLQKNKTSTTISSVSIYDATEKEKVIFRQIEFPVIIQGKSFLATVREPQAETEDLIQYIVLVTIIMLVILLGLLFFINRYFLKKLWNPFYKTLDELKKFSLYKKTTLHLESNKITEFAQLNESVMSMANQVKREYTSLKVFTENASHEMQTPLAIIRLKMDNLIQDENLNAAHLNQLNDIYNAVGKLQHLMQSLLLLTKIENGQFMANENVLLDKLITEKVNQFHELFQSKNIGLKVQLTNKNILFNKQLLEILLNNLLSNAVRYTRENGQLEIILNDFELNICNSGEIALNKLEIFNRFYKEHNSPGMGLGLAIIKQICAFAHFPVSYRFHKKMHCFRISFLASNFEQN